MTSNMNRTVYISIIALSLALFACADTHKREPAAPESSAPVAEAMSASPAAGAPTAKVSGTGAENGQAEPQGQVSGNLRLTEDERNTIEVVRKSRNSVVYVTNMQYVRDFFYQSDQPVPRGSGSG
ncbi:MAG: hypothetical protein ACXW3H_03730, partial [Candidatus Aminicenantales bacterium]